MTISEESLPQDQAVSSTSGLQLWLQNEGFVSSAQGTPCATDDEGDNLPDNSQRGKLPGKRQRSSEGQLNYELYVTRFFAMAFAKTTKLTIFAMGLRKLPC